MYLVGWFWEVRPSEYLSILGDESVVMLVSIERKILLRDKCLYLKKIYFIE